MEARMLAYGLAACTACGCGAFAVIAMVWMYRRRAVSAKALRPGDFTSAFIAWRLLNGYGWIKPIISLMLRYSRITGFVQQALRLIESRGYASTPEALLSILVALVAIVGGASGLLTQSLFAGIALALGVSACIAISVSVAYDKRNDAIRDTVPQALEAMQSCFSAGFTLLQTLQQISHDLKGPLGDLFARSAHILETGGTTEQALEILKKESDAAELAFVAVALDVQHQSGGALHQVLQAAIETVKGELSLRSSLRVQTAQAKLSARIVAIMPLILVAAFSLASPDYLLPFFSSLFGLTMLLLAVVMQLTGIALVRRALSVQGVTR